MCVVCVCVVCVWCDCVRVCVCVWCDCVRVCVCDGGRFCVCVCVCVCVVTLTSPWDRHHHVTSCSSHLKTQTFGSLNLKELSRR